MLDAALRVALLSSPGRLACTSDFEDTVAKGDEALRDFFASNLPEEEKHVNWLETELSLIDEVRDANYLAQQIHQQEGAARRRAGCRASLPQRFPLRLR